MRSSSYARPAGSMEQLARLSAGLAELADSPGTWSFAVAEALPGIDPTAGWRLTTVAQVKAGTAHSAASTIKLPLLIVALRRVDAGTWSLDVPVPGATTSLRHDLGMMVTVSDNATTNGLIDAIGLAGAGAEIRGLNLPGTVLERRLADPAYAGSGLENRTTAGDMVRSLGLLLAGSVLRPPSVDLALDLLEGQRVTDRMPALVDASVRCRHKTGELRGVRHDVGILEFDGRRVLLAALGSDIPGASGETLPCPEATRIIGGAAALVVQEARSAG